MATTETQSELKCGNCGAPAYAHTIVSSGNDRMAGLLCEKCIRVHKAEIIFRIPKVPEAK